MIKVEILILRGAMASSIAITIDVLMTANRLRAIVGRAQPFRFFASGSGKAIGGAMSIDTKSESGSANLLILPGLGLTTEEEVSARLSEDDVKKAIVLIKHAAETGQELATSCSGAFLFGHAGLLSGRRATTSWWLSPLFRRLFPETELESDALVVVDGPVTTAGAAMAQMDLMLALVARHAGASLADDCARYLLLDARRSQSRYMAISFLAANEPHVAKAAKWARSRLSDGFSIDELASAAGLSARTFARRVHEATGLSPIRFLQRLRVDAAMELLETTKLPFDAVAHQVGYADPSTLRRILARDANRTPGELRGSRDRSTSGSFRRPNAKL